MATDFSDKHIVIIIRVEDAPCVYSVMLSAARIRYHVYMTVRWPAFLPQCLRWWIRKIFLSWYQRIHYEASEVGDCLKGYGLHAVGCWLRRLESRLARYYKWICLLLWFILLYVGWDGDVEPQTVSITVVHLGEVVTSLWDVMPCGMVDRVWSQYYGTFVCRQLLYSLEYEGSGVYSAGRWGELIGEWGS